MIKFDTEQVLLLHKLVIQSSGGENGVRDFNLLESAMESPYHTFGGQDLFPTKQEKGARLGFGLISNHAFFDGNKRVGILAMLSFLSLNGIKVQYSDDELINLGISVADGHLGYEGMLKSIKSHEVDQSLTK